MAKPKSQAKVELSQGTVFEIDPNKKYLIVFPNDANIKQVAPAIREFCKPTPVFVLVAKDVNEIKIAELMEENNE